MKWARALKHRMSKVITSLACLLDALKSIKPSFSLIGFAVEVVVETGLVLPPK